MERRWDTVLHVIHKLDGSCYCLSYFTTLLFAVSHFLLSLCFGIQTAKRRKEKNKINKILVVYKVLILFSFSYRKYVLK